MHDVTERPKSPLALRFRIHMGSGEQLSRMSRARRVKKKEGASRPAASVLKEHGCGTLRRMEAKVKETRGEIHKMPKELCSAGLRQPRGRKRSNDRGKVTDAQERR